MEILGGFLVVVASVALLMWGLPKFYLARERRYFREEDARQDAEALRAYPTQDAVMSRLVVTQPCGCVEHWETGPPSGFSCREHIGRMATGEMPIKAWRAREVLRRKGLWK